MVIYTDGSCINNPGPGAYGALTITKQLPKILFVRTHKKTTNNEMELYAILICLIKF